MNNQYENLKILNMQSKTNVFRQYNNILLDIRKIEINSLYEYS